jgi:acetylornithine deacetylase
MCGKGLLKEQFSSVQFTQLTKPPPLHSHSGYPHLGKSATSTLLSVLTSLSGGSAHNILAPRATALCEVRMVADLAGTKAQISQIVARYPDVELKWVFEYPEALLEWEIDGFEAQPVAFGTDVPRLGEEWCGKRVLFGPGSILVAHGEGEYVDAKELVESIGGYKRLVEHFLQ